MSRAMDKKILKAKTLYLQGYLQKEIAEQLAVSVRTVRRYLSVDTDDEDQTELETIDPSLRGEFLSRAEPIMLAMLDRLQEQLDNDQLKGRDLILGAGLLFDKIGRLSPPAQESKPDRPAWNISVISPAWVEQEAQRIANERLLALGIPPQSLEVVENGEVVAEDTEQTNP